MKKHGNNNIVIKIAVLLALLLACSFAALPVSGLLLGQGPGEAGPVQEALPVPDLGDMPGEEESASQLEEWEPPPVEQGAELLPQEPVPDMESTDLEMQEQEVFFEPEPPLEPSGEVPPPYFVPEAGTPMVDAAFVTPPPKALGRVNIDDYFSIVCGSGDALGSGVYSGQGNVAVITQSQKQQKGAMWAREKLDLWHPFAFEMALYMNADAGVSSHRVADGMTFTIHNDDHVAREVNGQAGYYGVGAISPSREGHDLAVYSAGAPDGYIRNAITIEFDTFGNNGYDPFYAQNQNGAQHVAMLRPGNSFSAASHDEFTQAAKFDLHEGWYRFYATWEPYIGEDGRLYGELSYTFGDYVAPKGGRYTYKSGRFAFNEEYTTSSAVLDAEAIFGEAALEEGVWWGFTGSTGDFTSLQAAALLNMPDQTATKNVYDAEGNDLHGKEVAPGDIVTYEIQATWTRTAEANLGQTRFSFADDLDEGLEFIEGSGRLYSSVGNGGTQEEMMPVVHTPNPADPSKLLFEFRTDFALLAVHDYARLEFDVRVLPQAAGWEILNTATVHMANNATPFTTNTVQINVSSGDMTVDRVYQGDTAITGGMAARHYAKVDWPGGEDSSDAIQASSGTNLFSIPISTYRAGYLRPGEEVTVHASRTRTGQPYDSSTQRVQPLWVEAANTAMLEKGPGGRQEIMPGESFAYELRVVASAENTMDRVERGANVLRAFVTATLPPGLTYQGSALADGTPLAPAVERGPAGETILDWGEQVVPAYNSGAAFVIQLAVQAGEVAPGSELTSTLQAATVPGSDRYTASAQATVHVPEAGHTLTVRYRSLAANDTEFAALLAEKGITDGQRVFAGAERFCWQDVLEGVPVDPGTISARQAVYAAVALPESGEGPKQPLDMPLELEGDTVVNVYYGSTLLEVTVPARVFFYSLALDGGEVKSPVHSITNRSSLPVQVRLEQLTTTGEAEGVQIDDEGVRFAQDARQAVEAGATTRAMQLHMEVTSGGAARTLPGGTGGLAPDAPLGLELARLDGAGYTTGYELAGAGARQSAVFTIGGRYVQQNSTFPTVGYRPLVGFTFHFEPLPYEEAS